MTEFNLTQIEADTLLALEKRRVDEQRFQYPHHGTTVIIPLIAANKKEQFLLDLSRSAVNLAKGTYQNRARQVIVLARLDFGGAPHRNPDDMEIPCPHLHIYREGYGTKWAVQIPDTFRNIDDPWESLQDFMRFCNITSPPHIDRGLFI